MNKSHLKAVETPTYHDEKITQFANYVALVVTDRRTPRALKNALAAIIIEDIANSSGYAWDTDAEGLRFMLPRLLSCLNESYADGVISAAVSIAQELLPEAARREIRLGKGNSDE